MIFPLKGGQNLHKNFFSFDMGLYWGVMYQKQKNPKASYIEKLRFHVVFKIVSKSAFCHNSILDCLI